MVYGGFCSLKGVLQTLYKACGNNVRGLFYQFIMALDDSELVTEEELEYLEDSICQKTIKRKFKKQFGMFSNLVQIESKKKTLYLAKNDLSESELEDNIKDETDSDVSENMEIDAGEGKKVSLGAILNQELQKKMEKKKAKEEIQESAKDVLLFYKPMLLIHYLNINYRRVNTNQKGEI